MSTFHAGIIGLLGTLSSFLIMTFSPVHLGVLPAHVGPPHCRWRAYVSLTARGLWLDGRPVTASELPVRLYGFDCVALEADDGVPYDDVVQAIDAVRGAGVTEIGVLR